VATSWSSRARPVVEVRGTHRHCGQPGTKSRAAPVIVDAAYQISRVRVAEDRMLRIRVERLGVQRRQHGLRCSRQIDEIHTSQDRVIEPRETSAIARIYTVNIECGPSDASPHGHSMMAQCRPWVRVSHRRASVPKPFPKQSLGTLMFPQAVSKPLKTAPAALQQFSVSRDSGCLR
jgi:hypothetical protein